MTIAESAEMVTWAARLVTASAALNILCWFALIYASIQVRRAAETLRDAAQGIVSREGEDANAASVSEAN